MIDKLVQLATSKETDNHTLAIELMKGQNIKASVVIDAAIKAFAYEVFAYAVNKHLKDRRRKVFTLCLFGKETRFKVGIEIVIAQTKWFEGVNFTYHSEMYIYSWASYAYLKDEKDVQLSYDWIIDILKEKKKLLLGTSNMLA